MRLEQDHFVLFGLPRQFSLDVAALEHAYREIQAQVHPDRFANASDAERRVALQWATQVNEAFRTLKEPLKRASYLCESGGVDLKIESNTSMPLEFLSQQMEWREALEDAARSNDLEALETIDRDRRTQRKNEIATIATLIDEKGDLLGAAQRVRQLMFLDRFGDDVALALDKIESAAL